ncbi:MAG: nucleotide excision repair endonuclease [Verrucomicrobia bacterium]|nr:nucleotide excision repair endonuclease [Verrucomicrobiota bacterium]
MGERQLRLLPAAQPLVERLGREFFLALPTSPGVYWLVGPNGQLLYVGKARNLRQRLNSYRRTEGQSRRLIRLIHTASFVRWEQCSDEAGALAREAELIRTYQPTFNRAGKWSRSRKWVWLRRDSEGLETGLSDTSPSDHSLLAAGQPFGYSARETFTAWLRLLMLANHPDLTPLNLPRPLLLRRGPARWRLTLAGEWDEPLRSFLKGENQNLWERLKSVVSPRGCPFEQTLQKADWELLLGKSAPYQVTQSGHSVDSQTNA